MKLIGENDRNLFNTKYFSLTKLSNHKISPGEPELPSKPRPAPRSIINEASIINRKITLKRNKIEQLNKLLTETKIPPEAIRFKLTKNKERIKKKEKAKKLRQAVKYLQNFAIKRDKTPKGNKILCLTRGSQDNEAKSCDLSLSEERNEHKRVEVTQPRNMTPVNVNRKKDVKKRRIATTKFKTNNPFIDALEGLALSPIIK